MLNTSIKTTTYTHNNKMLIWRSYQEAAVMVKTIIFHKRDLMLVLPGSKVLLNLRDHPFHPYNWFHTKAMQRPSNIVLYSINCPGRKTIIQLKDTNMHVIWNKPNLTDSDQFLWGLAEHFWQNHFTRYPVLQKWQVGLRINRMHKWSKLSDGIDSFEYHSCTTKIHCVHHPLHCPSNHIPSIWLHY